MEWLYGINLSWPNLQVEVSDAEKLSIESDLAFNFCDGRLL